MMTSNNLLTNSKKITPKTLTIFYLLHEEGHYLDFIHNFYEKGLNGKDYKLRYDEEFDKIGKKFIKAYGSRKDDEAFKGYVKLYRENPFEKRADEYAIKKMTGNKKFLITYTQQLI